MDTKPLPHLSSISYEPYIIEDALAFAGGTLNKLNLVQATLSPIDTSVNNGTQLITIDSIPNVLEEKPRKSSAGFLKSRRRRCTRATFKKWKRKKRAQVAAASKRRNRN